MIVSTFEKDDREFVAMVEGKKMPVFGMLYSPQKSQFTQEAFEHVEIDQSMRARYHSQFMANYFVDNARESKNRADSFAEEQRLVINRFPSVFVESVIGSASGAHKSQKSSLSHRLVHTHSVYALNYADIRF